MSKYERFDSKTNQQLQYGTTTTTSADTTTTSATNEKCSLAPRTRQTVRTVLIALVSALALVAIFHLAKLAENQPTPDQDVTGGREGGGREEERGGGGREEGREKVLKSADGKVVKIRGSLYRGGPLGEEEEKIDTGISNVAPHGGIRDSGGMGSGLQAPNTNNNTSPVLDLLYRNLPVQPLKPLINIPIHDVERLHPKQQQIRRLSYTHPANDSEISETVEIVRRKVESQRKQLASKNLRLWSLGEVPLRILLISTWRSGSTFLAQALGSHPAVFEHYEPFSHIGIKQLRSGREAFQAQQLLHRLLDCQFEAVSEYSTRYLNYTKHHPQDMVGHNKVVWEACQNGPNPSTCFEASFLSRSCQLFPIQLVKTVRVRLNLTQLFLNDVRTNSKVVFLVRDPRATMSSRYNSVSWCLNESDCASPQVLCADLEGDLKVATALQHLYPNRFTMVKYEDIAEDPPTQIRALMDFLGLEYTRSTSLFLQEHTNLNQNSPWSTKRKSQDRIALWKKQLPLEEIHVVQNACESVLKSLKYELTGQ